LKVKGKIQQRLSINALAQRGLTHGGIMSFKDYYDQEPFSEAAQSYHAEVIKRAAALTGEEVRYGTDPYQSLVVFPAAKPNGPVLAFFHGGGWTNGYKEWMAFMSPALTGAGIVFVSVGYRLAPRHIYPTGFDDACAGVRWLSANAARFGAKPERLFVGGHSAGGHYAALMALTRPALQIRGCLPVSGVYDFGPQSGLSARPRFLGDSSSGNDIVASPIEQVGANPCPFLIAHGSNDFPHLMRQAERMAERLASAGGDVERIVLEGCNHFTASYACGEPNGSWTAKAIDWIARH
jgi:arylformamidase